MIFTHMPFAYFQVNGWLGWDISLSTTFLESLNHSITVSWLVPSYHLLPERKEKHSGHCWNRIHVSSDHIKPALLYANYFCQL